MWINYMQNGLLQQHHAHTLLLLLVYYKFTDAIYLMKSNQIQQKIGGWRAGHINKYISTLFACLIFLRTVSKMYRDFLSNDNT